MKQGSQKEYQVKLGFIKAAVIGLVLLTNSMFNLANAGLITGDLNVDNQHWVYLSTNDNIQGDLISTGNNWTVTDSFSTNLTAGTDYFLHIFARDIGGIVGFLGEFSLAGNEHVFSNGATEILTNAIDWNVSLSGWSNYVTVTMVNGSNGVAPLGHKTSC